MTALTKPEQQELVRLMNKITFPTHLQVFEAWCRVFGVACVEVVVIRNKDKNPEIFLTYREDKFFKGWHIPGRVCIPTEKMEDTLARVCREEIKMPILAKKFFDWFERPYGKGVGQCPRGHEFAFVFTTEPKKKIADNHVEKFFPLNNLPKDLIPLHKPIVRKLVTEFGVKLTKKKKS